MMRQSINVLRIALVATLFIPSLSSGSPLKSNEGKIVGGEDAAISDYPWSVSFRNVGLGYSHFCGGSIINEQWVLTAAQCMDTLAPASHSVVAGQENLHENGDPNKQKISINQVFKHPNFNYISHEFDIALVKLEDTFEFNDFVAPVILNNEVIPNGVYCTATGWGFQAEDDVLLASTLQKVEVPIVSDDQCLLSYPDLMDGDYMICAGEAGKGSCHMDTGGPLTCQIPAGTAQVGVTSFYGCGQENVPGAYTDVSLCLDWIYETIESNT